MGDPLGRLHRVIRRADRAHYTQDTSLQSMSNRRTAASARSID
jgi:hypothetical protein